MTKDAGVKAISKEIKGNEIESYILKAANYIESAIGTLLESRMSKGKFYAVVPENVSLENLAKFSKCGILPVGTETIKNGQRIVKKLTLDEDFAKLLTKKVNEFSQSMIVGFDAAAKPESRRLNAMPIDLTKPPFGIWTRKDFELAAG